MPDLESHWLAERLAYLGRSMSKGTGGGQKMRDAFPRLESSPKAEGRCQPSGEASFARECRKALRNLLGSSDLSRSRKERLCWSLEKVRSQWNWAPSSGFLNNSEFSLTWQLSRNALPLADLAFKLGLADMPDFLRRSSGLEETALHAFYYWEQVRPFWSHVSEWTACIDPKQHVLLDVGYVEDNVDPLYRDEMRVA